MEGQVENFILRFTGILYEALPFIILGAVISGLLEELVPQRIVAKVIPRNRVLAIAIGGLLGILFPMCECGIIPVMRRLLRKGVPLSTCVCYMLAGPIINLVVMLSTWVAFRNPGDPVKDYSGNIIPQLSGLQMMAMRMGLGYLVAFGTSLIVEWQYRKHGSKLLASLAVPKGQIELDDADEEDAQPSSVWQRVGNITETAMHDFVDITVFLILGGLLASLSRVLIPQQDIVTWSLRHPQFAILVMMGMAIVLCICSEADAFIAASYGPLLPPSAKLAFLVLGPMLDLKLYMMYTRVFRPRLIWTIIVSVVVQVFIYAWITHWALGTDWRHLFHLAAPASPGG